MGEYGRAEPWDKPAGEDPRGYREPRLPRGPHPLKQQAKEASGWDWSAQQVRPKNN